MLKAMSNNWWMLVIRGIFALLFGALAIIVPGITLTVLVLMFGLYVLLEGAVTTYMSLSHRELFEHWWVGLLEGVVGVAAGILTFVWPGITGLILLYLIAAWAIITGILEIVAAYQIRREITNELWLGFSGVASLIFGILLVISPVSGAVAVSWLIGIYALVFGGSMIALGLSLRDSSSKTIRAS